MVEDIFLVINNTDQDFRITDFSETYSPSAGRTAAAARPGIPKISLKRNEHTTIKIEKEKKKREPLLQLTNVDSYKRISLSDDGENSVDLKKEDIVDNIGAVIMKGRNNRLVKVTVSKEESKARPAGKKDESENELKDRLIEIVKRRIEKKPNEASAHPSQSGDGEHFGKSEQKNDSAGLPRKNKRESRDQGKQNNASLGSSQKVKGEDRGQGGQNNASTGLSQGEKEENCGHGGKKNASTNPPTHPGKIKGKPSARVSKT